MKLSIVGYTIIWAIVWSMIAFAFRLFFEHVEINDPYSHFLAGSFVGILAGMSKP